MTQQLVTETKTEEKKEKITRTMTVGEIVKTYPETIEIMLSKGLHCVGCGASYWETLEQGTMGHGMSEETLTEMINEMNKAITQSDPTKVINITDAAAHKLKEILTKEKKEAQGLRIRVMPGGCAGYQYGLAIEEQHTQEDTVIEEKQVKIFVDKESMKLLQGAKVDYVDSLQGAGFRISNPNAHSSCGCGNSFT